MAGACATPGCTAHFCALHWRHGNRRCPVHGWKGDDAPTGPSDFRAGLTPQGATIPSPDTQDGDPAAMSTPEQPAVASNESRIREWARKHLTVEQAKKAMLATIDLAGKAGHAAGALIARLRNAKNPDEMLKAIDESLATNKARSQPLAERTETLYKEIAARKKNYEAAPPARKKLLELELRNLLAAYKAAERELTAFYDNEHSLNVVRGRLLELMAHGMRKLDEGAIDKLTDDIEDAVTDAEGVRDAVRDLDKAGPRRERESDQESFADALAGFDTMEAQPEAPDQAPEVEKQVVIPAPERKKTRDDAEAASV
jgi:hypothetical protein